MRWVLKSIPMKREEFTIRYHGHAADDSTIDAVELGTALVAIGQLESSLYKATHPKDTRGTTTNVVSTEEGSFLVTLSTVPAAMAVLTGLFDWNALSTASTLTGINAVSFLGMLKERANGKNVNITIEGDGNTVNLAIVENLRHAKRIVAPATENEDAGIVLEDANQKVAIDHDEAVAISRMAPDDDEPIIDYVDDVVTPGNINADNPTKYKWRLHCRQLGTINAHIYEESVAKQLITAFVDGQRYFLMKIRREQHPKIPGTTTKQPRYEVIKVEPAPGIHPQDELPLDTSQ